MNIDLPSYYQHVVIDSMARALLSEVRGQRLTGIGSLPPSSRSELREVQAIVRSVPAGRDRQSFISRLGYHFKQLRDEQGMEPRSTAFYAQVAAYQRSLK